MRSNLKVKFSELEGTEDPEIFLLEDEGYVAIPKDFLSQAMVSGDDPTLMCVDATSMSDSTPIFQAISFVPGTKKKTHPSSGRGPATSSVSESEGRKVFVIHGRNSRLNAEVRALLRALGLTPIEWSQARVGVGKATPYTWEVVDFALNNAAAIVVLLTPDDVARLHPSHISENDELFEQELRGQPRQNVLFEAGAAFGRGKEKVVMVQVGKLRPISDLAGHHILRLDDSIEARKELAARLESAGCLVDDSGTDWLYTGTFDAAMPAVEEPVPEPINRMSPFDALRRYIVEYDQDAAVRIGGAWAKHVAPILQGAYSSDAEQSGKLLAGYRQGYADLVDGRERNLMTLITQNEGRLDAQQLNELAEMVKHFSFQDYLDRLHGLLPETTDEQRQIAISNLTNTSRNSAAARVDAEMRRMKRERTLALALAVADA